jgi:hypothetical protein
MAPLVVGLALVVTHTLLTRLVPAVWASLLPGGLASAYRLRGWPGLVWRLALECPRSPVGPTVLAVAVVVVGTVACRAVPSLRWPFRLAALLAVALAAGILYVTIATAQGAALAGIGSPPVFAPEFAVP